MNERRHPIALLAGEDGQAGVGYALVGLLIAVAVGASALSLGEALSGAFGKVAERIEAATPSSGSRVTRGR